MPAFTVLTLTSDIFSQQGGTARGQASDTCLGTPPRTACARGIRLMAANPAEDWLPLIFTVHPAKNYIHDRNALRKPVNLHSATHTMALSYFTGNRIGGLS